MRMIAFLAALLFATAANAADLKAPRAAPTVPPACNWCGFVIGAHGGYGWSRGTVEDPTLALLIDAYEPAGFVVGGQVGFFTQYNAIVFGVEGDASYVRQRESQGLAPGVNTALKIDFLASARAVIGVELTPAVLAYATGGVGFAHTEGTISAPGVTLVAPSTRTGWVIGGGGKVKLTRNWNFGVEGLYYSFNSAGMDFGPISTPSDLTVGVARARLELNF